MFFLYLYLWHQYRIKIKIETTSIIKGKPQVFPSSNAKFIYAIYIAQLSAFRDKSFLFLIKLYLYDENQIA